MYRCEAMSISALVQQLAVSYIGNGYWFYVTGRIPDGKDVSAVDRKLMERYEVPLSKWARGRRRAKGEACVHYIRHERFFVLIACRGEHRFFLDEPHFLDVRREPPGVAGDQAAPDLVGRLYKISSGAA